MNQEKTGQRICYFDLETQKGADEVGGWGNIHLMRMAVGIVYDSLDKKYYTYFEKDADELIKKISTADLVVGFNIIRFDYKVLSAYKSESFNLLPSFDILVSVQSLLGYRLSLSNIASATLNAEKSADGLQSLEWFKQGKMDEIVEYCKKDVEITRDIFLFGVENSYIFFDKKDKERLKLPVQWDMEKLIEENKKLLNLTKSEIF